jgi:hypothetical protein
VAQDAEVEMKKGLMLAFCVFVLGAGSALADIVPIGDPQLVGSWAQRFQANENRGFSSIQVGILLGGPFEMPTIRNFSDYTWSILKDGSTDALAKGSSLKLLQFNLAFISNLDDLVTFLFQAFDDHGNVIDSECLTHDKDHSWQTFKVPEPTTATLLLCSLGMGLIAYGLKRP